VKFIERPTVVANQPEFLLAPEWAEIVRIEKEAEGVATYWLRFTDERIRQNYRFVPGQFNMLYVPGYGEAAISISSDASKPELVGHTIRFIGNVTNAIRRMKQGDLIGVRGPFGNGWPLASPRRRDLIIATGGIGMAPLRPVVYHLIKEREKYGKITLLYGARSPKDLLYTQEFDTWRDQGIEILVTVDQADEDWTGQVGVVPMLFYRLRVGGDDAVVMTCGPEIMMRFVVFEALARRIPEERIYLSMERNMKCGQGFCGHCQWGPSFICKEGPIYSLDQLQDFFNVEHF